MSNAAVIHVAVAEFAKRIRESAAEGRPLRVEADGRRFVLQVSEEYGEVEDDIWANYDPDKAREALRKYAGSWSDLDRDELIENLYRAREEGTRPPGRP